MDCPAVASRIGVMFMFDGRWFIHEPELIAAYAMQVRLIFTCSDCKRSLATKLS